MDVACSSPPVPPVRSSARRTSIWAQSVSVGGTPYKRMGAGSRSLALISSLYATGLLSHFHFGACNNICYVFTNIKNHKQNDHVLIVEEVFAHCFFFSCLQVEWVKDNKDSCKDAGHISSAQKNQWQVCGPHDLHVVVPNMAHFNHLLSISSAWSCRSSCSSASPSPLAHMSG